MEWSPWVRFTSSSIWGTLILSDNLAFFRLSDCFHFLTVCGLVVDEDFHAFCNLLTKRTPTGMRIRRFVVSEMRLQYVYLYADAEEFESALFSALDFTHVAIEIPSYHFLVYANHIGFSTQQKRNVLLYINIATSCLLLHGVLFRELIFFGAETVQWAASLTSNWGLMPLSDLWNSSVLMSLCDRWPRLLWLSILPIWFNNIVTKWNFPYTGSFSIVR